MNIKRPKLLVLLPAFIFVLVAAAALNQLYSGRNISAVPSALLGKPAPQFELGVLDKFPPFGINISKSSEKPIIVNVWASWCAPCREENGLLLKLSEDDRYVLAGINYKDKSENALEFLNSLGNPFDKIGTDQNGRAAIEWGVYGVPETFIVGRDGTILFKHIGPLTEKDLSGAFGQTLAAASK